ncbi:hypothetical protein ACYOEI_14075 [Singulisphaera rosea]
MNFAVRKIWQRLTAGIASCLMNRDPPRPNRPMNEQEWMTCPEPLMLIRHVRGNVSPRKLRLFACACFRRVWNFLPEGDRRLVEITERLVDENATLEELMAAFKESPKKDGYYCLAYQNIDRVARASADRARDIAWSSVYIVEKVLMFKIKKHDDEANRRREVERIAQVDLFRDLIGNPFRPLVVESAWLTSDVIALAREIYDERSFDRLPQLATALERQGCFLDDLLRHCREGGEHARGCWVVDGLLGLA